MTGGHERATEREYIDVRKSAFRRDHWFFLCSCGVKGDLRPSYNKAALDGDEHLELVHDG